MVILYKQKKLSEITNHNELENFISEQGFFKYFKKIPQEFIEKVNLKIKDCESINYKSFKPWYRDVINYPETVYDPNFLKMMGWDEVDVINFITDKQKQNSKILSDKKKLNPEQYYDKTVKRKEYWIKKGYTEEEAIKKTSEIQKTFSKDLCIKKYGEIKGIEIFEKRQKKWVETLSKKSNISEIRKKQNSYNYETKDLNELIDRTSFTENTKRIIKKGIQFNNINDFVNYVLSKNEFLNLTDLSPYIKSKIVQKKYNINIEELKNLFYGKISSGTTSNMYGKMIYHNGNLFKSIGEFKISKFLEENNIKYEYEKRYPNSKFYCDFYLSDFDVYIEYYGMLDKKNLNKLDENQQIYLDKMNEKNLFFKLNNLSFIEDVNLEKLLKKIKKQLLNENND